MENQALHPIAVSDYDHAKAVALKQPVTLKSLVRQSWLALLAIVALLIMMFFTSPVDTTQGVDLPIEKFAHDLGHGINSVWVGVGLIILIVPSLVAMAKRRERPIWAWRALDAIFLDFLCVDAIGKDLFTGLIRPNSIREATPFGRPGFPSGHATMAFLMAWLVWRRYPKLGPLWFTFAALIAWSRAEVHAHFPYQIWIGAALGTALGALVTSRRAGVLLPRILLSDDKMRGLLNEEANA